MPEEKVEQQEAGKAPIKSLRTYQGDVEEAVQKSHLSASSILVAEQNRKDGKLLELETPEDSGARNKFYILVGSILLVLGITTISAMYYLKSKEEVIIEQKTKTLIAYSEEKTISIASSTKEDFIREVLAKKDAFQLPVNSVLYLNIIDNLGNPEKIEKFFNLVTPLIPPSLARSFSDEYIFGIYSFDTNEPFLILTTNDFASSWSGMLKWEKDMVVDFGKLFSLPQNIISTVNQFKDETQRNKDLRVLRAANGKTVLLYSFVDKNTLVITANESIFNAIVGKYNISKQVR